MTIFASTGSKAIVTIDSELGIPAVGVQVTPASTDLITPNPEVPA